jgi:hypothetical protein
LGLLLRHGGWAADAAQHGHQEAELVIDAFRGSAHQYLASVYGRSSDELMKEIIAYLVACAEQQLHKQSAGCL